MTSNSAKIAIKASGFLSKRRGLFLFKLLLSFAILSYLVSHLDAEELLAALRDVRLSALVMACGLLPLNIGLQFFKWHYLLRRAVRPMIAPRFSFYSLLAGFPLGLLTPGRWGELGRAFFLPQLNERKVMVLAAFDKIFDLLLSLLLGAIALLYLTAKKMLPAELFMPCVALLALVVMLNALALQPSALKSFLFLIKRKTRAKPSSLRVLTLFSRKERATIWLISFGFALTYSLQFVLLLRGFVEVPFFQGMLGVSAAFFAKSLLPIALGDLGVREGAAAFFFARMAISPQAAFNASLLLFLINLLLPSLLGMALIWKYRASPSFHSRRKTLAP
jgi:uncharacterized membrane protein YbhN (UPF0104 family)